MSTGEFPFELSVVVAAADSRAPIAPCLAALEAACRGLGAELVVAQAGDITHAYAPSPGGPVLRVITCEPGTLVPQLWSAGVAAARGEAVAFTLSNCIVSRGWANALLRGLRSGAVGVGGPLQLSAHAPSSSRAMYFLRYSAFLPGRFADGIVEGEIPGDNAAYRHAELRRERDSLRQGFWEVDFHRRVRARGGVLRAAGDAVVTFEPAVTLGAAARQRFAHGRHFGAWRVQSGARRTWQVVAASPLVPLLLAGRVATRVLPDPELRLRFVTAIPSLLALTMAWAAGEAWGALAGSGLSEPRGEPGVIGETAPPPASELSDGSR